MPKLLHFGVTANLLRPLTRHWIDAPLVILAIIIVWLLFSQVGATSLAFPPIFEFFRSLAELISSGDLLEHSMSSITRVLVGWLIALLFACALSLFCILIPISYRVASIIEFIRPIPPIALIPLAIIWFGIGDVAAIFLVFIGGFPPMFVALVSGIRQIESSSISTARILGANTSNILIDVVLPQLFPVIISAARVGFATCWLCVIAAEMVGTHSGLGYLIQVARQLLDTGAVLVGIFTIGLVGLLFNFVLEYWERKSALWRYGL